MKIRFDGKDYDLTKPEDAAAYQQAVADFQARHVTALATEKARADKAEGERDAARADLTKARTDAADTTRLDALVNERVALLATAGKLLGATYVAETTDAKGQKVSKSNRDVMLDVIRGDDKDFKDTGPDGQPRSDEYVRARYDAIAEKGVRADSIVNLPGVVKSLGAPPVVPTDPTREDTIDPYDGNAARNRMVDRNRKASEKKAS